MKFVIEVVFLMVVGTGMVAGELVERTPGYTYRVHNKGSSLYMSEVSNMTPSKTKEIEQWPAWSGADRNSQVWHAFPIEGGQYLLCNKRTGLTLVVYNNSPTPGDPMNQFVLQRITNAADSFTIQLDAGTTVYYLVKIVLSSLYLNINSYSLNNGSAVQQWYLQTTNNRAFQQWSFEQEEVFQTVVDANKTVERDINDIGAVPRITTWIQPSPSKTNEVLVGQVVIPYVLVKDPVLTLAQQSMQTPYYFLRRYAYWQMVYFYEYNGPQEATVSLSVPVGLITNNNAAINTTLDMSVVDYSLYLGLFPSKIKTQIANGLKIKVDGTATGVSTRMLKLDRTYNSDKRQSEAVWFRQDHYVLERINGDRILEWITRDPAIGYDDVFTGDL